MKSIALLLALISVSTVSAQTKDNPVYTQCTVEVPGYGDVAGLCRDTGEKHYAIITCEGELLAFVQPGALPRVDGATCGSKYKGFPGNKS